MTDVPISLGGAPTDADETRSDRPVALTIAAIASMGAGAIHAAAIGSHAGMTGVVRAFTAAAIFQLGWGVLLLVRASRPVIWLGVLGNLALVGGWALAKTEGISFIDGFAEPMSAGYGDSVAAVLAAAAAGFGLVALWRPSFAVRRGGISVLAAGTAALLLVATGTASASSPDHHGGSSAAHPHGGETASTDHHGGDVAAASTDHHASATAVEEDEPAVAVPYDPTKPIDLGGVEGLTPAQQAAAENIVANTLLHLPRWADPAVAEAEGFSSIHDSVTGYEHFINTEYQSDGRVLDPDRPESLVYQHNAAGERQLVAAMYMAEPGTTLDTVDDFGGPLTQWHIHDNLCFTPGDNSVVAGLTDAQGNCAAPLVKPEAVPMIHVWITSHPCGPFAALEGIAGGQISEDETRLCDHAHGGH